MHTFLKDCRHGRFVLVRGDMVSSYVDLYGEWSELEVKLFSRLLKPDSVVIEVGSNLGMHSVPLGNIVPDGRVVCFEPQRPIFNILCGNIALNNLLNVHAHRLAVGERNETVAIASTDYEAPWNYSAFSLSVGFNRDGQFFGGVESERVEVVTLDQFPDTADLERLDLLKLDAEGMELPVLRGARTLIERTRPILFVENDKAGGDDLIGYIRGLGYYCYWYHTERFSWTNYNRAPWKVDGTDANMVCFPKGEALPVKGLPRAESFGQLERGEVPLVEVI
jgi:FkbM family methyltransferase